MTNNIIATYFKTTAYGGMEGRDIITKRFTTEALARKTALDDTWCSGYSLIKVTLIDNDGYVKEEYENLGDIPCGRDYVYIEEKKRYIAYCDEQIEKIKNSKRKEANKEKAIKEYEDIKADALKIIAYKEAKLTK